MKMKIVMSVAVLFFVSFISFAFFFLRNEEHSNIENVQDNKTFFAPQNSDLYMDLNKIFQKKEDKITVFNNIGNNNNDSKKEMNTDYEHKDARVIEPTDVADLETTEKLSAGDELLTNNNEKTSQDTNNGNTSLLDLLNAKQKNASNNVSDKQNISKIDELLNPGSSPSSINKPSALKDFGNELAKLFKSFEKDNPNQIEIFDSFLKSPNKFNAEKMSSLAKKYFEFADQISSLEAPYSAASVKDNISRSTRLMGEAMLNLSKQKTDMALYTFVNEYNKKAEDAARALLGFVNLLNINGIRYAPNEPGNIFMFSR